MDPRSVTFDIQDEDVVRQRIQRHQRLLNDRSNWESIWRDVEARVDPVQQGGFVKMAAGNRRGLDIFDSTATLGLGRYEAGIGGVLIPRKQIWFNITTSDPELNKRPEVQRWCYYATMRIMALIYEPRANFETNFYQDIRSGGLYGTSPLIVDERIGAGVYFRALHMSEVCIDVDHAGFVDTVDREYSLTLRQIVQKWGEASISERMMADWTDKDRRKWDKPWPLLQTVAPNPDYNPDRWDWRGKPIESITISLDDKWILKRSGFATMPIPVSRVTTSPGDKYGRSPAMMVLGTIKGLNEMAKTIIKQAHKASEPAWAFHDDGLITKLSTKPGGLNPGMVDERGTLLARPLEQGGQLPFTREVQEDERGTVRSAFLEEVFDIVYKAPDRATATQIIEQAAKTGVLIAPSASRIESEKADPTIMRVLDIGLRSGAIAPPPPVMREAGAKVRPMYQNPLSRMARMEAVSGFTQWTQSLLQLAGIDPEALDIVDFDEAGRGSAEILGVPPAWVRTPEQVAAKRQQRAEEKQQQSLIQGLQPAGNAALAFAKAGQAMQAGDQA